MSRFQNVFGAKKPVIAMVHLGASPGTPLHDAKRGIEGIIADARADFSQKNFDVKTAINGKIDGGQDVGVGDLYAELQVGSGGAPLAQELARLVPNAGAGVGAASDPVADRGGGDYPAG